MKCRIRSASEGCSSAVCDGMQVIVGWARAEEEGRAAAQAQAEQGEEVAARLSAKVEELQVGEAALLVCI